MRVEQIADVSERLEQGVKGSGTDASQVGLEFREGHLDGIEIGAVCGQEQEPAAALSQGLCRAWAFVGGQVVEDDNGPRIKRRGQLRLDIGVESRSVHRALDHPGRDQGILRQPGDEGLRAPFAKRCRAIEPLTDRGPSAQPREVRLDRRLVDKDQPVRLLAHAGLAALDPITAGPAQRRSVTFRRDQSFFYMTVRRVRARDAAKRAAPPRHVSRPGRRPIP